MEIKIEEQGEKEGRDGGRKEERGRKEARLALKKQEGKNKDRKEDYYLVSFHYIVGLIGGQES